MKIIELLCQSIHPSLENRSQNDGLSHLPDVYPNRESLLKGKKQTADHANSHDNYAYLYCIPVPI